MADQDATPAVISRTEAQAAGLARYFTGEPCIFGHICERYVSNYVCARCQSNRRIAFYWKNREREIEKVKAHYQINKAALRKRANAYDAAHPEKRKAAFAAWYAINKVLYLSKRAEARLADRDLFNRRYKEWAAANPEKVMANVRSRAARKKGAEGRHSGDDIKALYRLQRGKCAYCRASLKSGHNVDHIVPLAKGGSNWPKNLQLTCADCNRRKNAKDPLVWARQVGRLF